VDGRDKEGPSRQNGGMDLPRPLPARVVPPPLPRLIAARLPVFYGWVVLACLCCAGFARQGPAVATLSIFVEPLTREFGWSRTALSGAVSLGGVLAAISAPLIGPLLDRRGSRLVLCAAVLVNGIALLLLSATGSLLHFYLLFCLARMNWAGPFDLGIYGALSNWFVRRRTFATSIATLAQQAGLVAMPLLAQFAILQQGWRAGWLAIGAATLLIGFVPAWLLLVRRPEDLLRLIVALMLVVAGTAIAILFQDAVVTFENDVFKAIGGVSLDYGVRVVGVNPGPIATDRMMRIMKRRARDNLGDEARWQEYLTDYPGGRMGTDLREQERGRARRERLRND